MHRLLDSGGIRSVRVIEPRKGQFSPFPPGISPIIISGLRKSGITSLYTHQAEAIKGVLAGSHIVITTNTASGKSMAYTIPVLNTYLDNPGVKALYLTPAKALGQNQRKTINDICDRVPWPGARPGVEVCDGDTEFKVRREILSSNNFVVTTPDMLHASLLPKHLQYKDLFRNLRFVIIDEAHSYRGIFGNNVCHVMRRLLRLCRHYGASPTFILCTATIANPHEFSKNLVGLNFEVVNNDTSPSGPKKVVFYEPPQFFKKDGGLLRRLTHYEAARALGNYIEKGHRVIVFGKSRKVVESAYKKLADDFPSLKGKVTPYKGSLVPETRRSLEKDLFRGVLRGVITTNALELGIDIGDLDVCILCGFPGSISSTWQQAGRAGRSGQEALIVLMAGEDPLDLFLVRNSSYFFGQSCEKAIVSPDKAQLLDHILCASRELPLEKEDSQYWAESQYYKAVKALYEQGSLELVSDSPKKYCGKGVAERFGLRGESDQYSVVTPGRKIVERYELKDLLASGYPGSILNIMGSSYVVKEINFDSKEIMLADLPPDLAGSYTLPALKSGISGLHQESQNEASKIPTFYGELTVTNSIEEYILVKPGGAKKQFTLAQKINPHRLATIGIWLDFPEESFGAQHAIEHLIRIVLPWLVMCERSDLGSHIEGNRIYIYDNHPGGIGLVESALPMVNELLQRCYEVLIGCGCRNGCPSCIHIPQCHTRNEDLDKGGALKILAGILGHKLNASKSGQIVTIKASTRLRPAARHKNNNIPQLTLYRCINCGKHFFEKDMINFSRDTRDGECRCCIR